MEGHCSLDRSQFDCLVLEKNEQCYRINKNAFHLLHEHRIALYSKTDSWKIKKGTYLNSLVPLNRISDASTYRSSLLRWSGNSEPWAWGAATSLTKPQSNCLFGLINTLLTTRGPKKFPVFSFNYLALKRHFLDSIFLYMYWVDVCLNFGLF